MAKISNIKHLPGSDIVCLEGGRSKAFSQRQRMVYGGVMYTLNTTEVHAVCYRISSYHSNSMKSSNPHSGIYETDVCNTLGNMNCGYPACNQGGVMVVEIHHTGTPPK